MRRADLLLSACVALAGCMKIYPDPELPDIEVSWYDGDCREGTGDVIVTLEGVDDPTDHIERRVPCTDTKVTFADVSRERYHVTGTLLDAVGVPFSAADEDADLRDGIGERISLFFGGGANVRIGFVFDMGATCESLNALVIDSRIIAIGEPTPFRTQTFCGAGAVFAFLPDGMFTVELRAVAFETDVVAVSEMADFEVVADGLTSVGPLTLVPCGASCPAQRATLAP